jgi:hypothetical protein
LPKIGVATDAERKNEVRTHDDASASAPWCSAIDGSAGNTIVCDSA